MTEPTSSTSRPPAASVVYGLTIAHQSAAVVAGTAQGGTDCSPGASQRLRPTSLYFQSAAPFVDSSDNVYFSDNETAVSGAGCAWVLPAQSGNIDGMNVTAGNVYKLAGNGGTTATSMEPGSRPTWRAPVP